MVYFNKITNTAIFAAIILSIAVVAVQANADVKQTREQIQNTYLDFLTEEGYRPNLDEDGDVAFKHDGKNYFIPTSIDKRNFFAIVLPRIWSFETEEEFGRILKAADYSNRKSKVSKVYTLDNNVWITIEMFLPSPDDFNVVFETAMGTLDNGLDNFVSKMKEKTQAVKK